MTTPIGGIMYPCNDNEYRERTITAVNDGSFTCDDGWSFWVDKDSPVRPRVGAVARFYGRGIGYVVRGLFIDGQKVYYRTVDEEGEYAAELAARRDVERMEEFERERASLDADYAALPEPFRKRIDRFRAGNEDFRWQFEAYEMSVCRDAVSIATSLKSREAIAEFARKPWDEQLAAVPGLFDGHSGNSFGCAVSLADLYVKQPDLVIAAHGALTPLVGCKDYGCTHENEARIE